MEKFAYEIKMGDKLNLHCDGWKVVKYVDKGFMVKVVFEDGTERTHLRGDRVFAV